MSDNSQIFFNKKILIYGLGKSGLSSFNFLRNKNDVYLFDDNPNLKINKSIKKKTLNFKKLLKIKFVRFYCATFLKTTLLPQWPLKAFKGQLKYSIRPHST